MAQKRANDRQVGGTHYQNAAVQHWDFVQMHKMPNMEAQLFNYVLRWRNKDGSPTTVLQVRAMGYC